MYKDITGNTYGRVTVLRFSQVKKYNAYFICKCTCGNEFEVMGKSLRNGDTKSCGCLLKEKSKERATKHNLCNSRLYSIYHSMLNRCYSKNNTNYKSYGGRGVKVCESWNNKKDGFINFYNWAINNGYANNLSIDRINVNGNYEPNNCRWATSEEQSKNRRTNIYLIYNDQKYIKKDLANLLNIDIHKFDYYLKKGLSVEEIASLKSGVR